MQDELTMREALALDFMLTSVGLGYVSSAVGSQHIGLHQGACTLHKGVLQHEIKLQS